MIYFFKRLTFTFSLGYLAKVVFPSLVEILKWIGVILSGDIVQGFLGLFFQGLASGLAFAIFYGMWRLGSIRNPSGSVSPKGMTVTYAELPDSFQEDHRRFTEALFSLILAQASAEDRAILHGFVRTDSTDQAALSSAIDSLRSDFQENGSLNERLFFPDLASINKDESRILFKLALPSKIYTQEWRKRGDHWEINALALAKPSSMEKRSNFA